MIYIEIIDNKPTRSTSFEQIGKNYQNVVTTDYEDYTVNNNKYIFEDGKVKLNPDYEEEQKQKERERIANLSLTRGDVFRGLLLAKQVTRADIRSLIELMPEDTPQQRMEKEYALIDFDESLNFYRGVALIDTLGAQLNITPAQMDRFFDTNDWHELVNEEPEQE